MPYYALLEPTNEEAYNMYLLYKARKYKRFFAGTYYMPRRLSLRPIFRMVVEPRDEVFERVLDAEVERSYKMVCLNCGACCARNSGAFAFEDELVRALEKLGEVVSLPFRKIKLVNGETVKVYELGVREGGRCVFYREGGCALEGTGAKPMICLIHYCSMFAEKEGKFYVKVSVKRVKGKVVPVYREANREEILKRLKRWL